MSPRPPTHRLTHLAPQGHLDKSFFFLLFFLLISNRFRTTALTPSLPSPSPHVHEGHPRSPTTTPLAARKRICHRTAPSPTQLTDPVVPNLVAPAPAATSPPL